MNANLILNTISFSLKTGLLDDAKKYLLQQLPWATIPGKNDAQYLVGDKIFGRKVTREDGSSQKFFLFIELTVGDYFITLTTFDRNELQFRNKLTWQHHEDFLAASKEW